MDVIFQCNGSPLENVDEFKYLGLIINRARNSPTAMLEKRISKAKVALNNIKCYTRLLGLFKRRVRIQLV
jgi:hypothetical protein